LSAAGVWFAGSKYGISWKAVQIRVDSIPDRIRGFAFLDDGESASSAAPAPAPRATKAAPAPNTFQALAEDEEVDDEEVFAPAAPTVTAAPKAAAPVFDDEADDVAPVALPKKVTTVKKVVAKVAVAPKKA
jgi:hypothetical protein